MFTTDCYFHAASLERRFIEALDRALREGTIQALERVWLHAVPHVMATDDPDPVRVDRLWFGDASHAPLELAGALMLSHDRTDDPKVYLYSPALGIQGFADRNTLLSALRRRFAGGDSSVVFEREKVEGRPFEAQMQAILDQQAGLLQQMMVHLERAPSLIDVSAIAIEQVLRHELAPQSIDPRTHLLQLMSGGQEPKVLGTCTLAQAAYDDVCQREATPGSQRHFLAVSGAAASETDAVRFTQALSHAVAAAPAQYAEQLNAFWGRSWYGTRTLRDLAAEQFHNALQNAFHRERHAGSLDDDALNTLLPLVQSSEDRYVAGPRCKRLQIKVGDGTWHALAATFVVQSATSGDQSLWWFAPDQQWVRFNDQAAMQAYVSSESGRGRIRETLTLASQPCLLQPGVLQLAFEPIQGALAQERVASILALQAHNLGYALALPRAPEKLPMMIDDALDVRALLDARLLLLGSGRWRRTAPFGFRHLWLAADPAAVGEASAVPEDRDGRVATQAQTGGDNDVGGAALATPDNTVEPERAPGASWLQQTRAFDTRAERLRSLGNGLIEYAEQLLQPYVSVLIGEGVAARSVSLRWLESAPEHASDIETQPVPVTESQQAITLDLVSLLLECITGHRTSQLPLGAQALVESSSVRLPVALISHVLDTLKARFVDGYIAFFQQSRGYQRQGVSGVRPAAEAQQLREDVMRLSLALAERRGTVAEGNLAMVRQVLERPVRSLRGGLDQPLTEVFSVSLTANGLPHMPLCDVLLFSQPTAPDNPVLLWSCQLGWFAFASTGQLADALQARLQGAPREQWLKHLGAADADVLREHLLQAADYAVRIRLTRVDDNVFSALEQQVLARQRQNLQQVCQRARRDDLEAGLFSHLVAACQSDETLELGLDELSMGISATLFQAMLPDWVTSASVDDLLLFDDILRRYYLACADGQDFMFGIPSLRDYARKRLCERLLLDFPDLDVDPDRIIITSRSYVTAYPAIGQTPSGIPAATVEHQESLTRFSINRFVNDQDATLSVDATQQAQAVGVLTSDYVQRLVRELDVGEGYIALLRRALTPNDSHYAMRRRLFIEQLPPALLAMALPEKLQGTLSEQAYGFITSVMEMPDGMAREPVNDVPVIFSPLQLVADAGMAPDPVTGAYLIGPGRGTGPWVLYVTYHAAFVFREYASQAALMDDVRRDATLQRLLLERLDPEVRQRYDHGGFTEPHLPFSVEGLYDVPVRAPGPVTLGISEVKGNALQFLFNNTVKLILDTGVSNVVTNTRADQAGRAFLAMLGFEQALGFLPGKLGALVGLWQSHSLISASATSLTRHRWGEAISEFSAALGVMLSAREQRIKARPSEGEPAETPPVSERPGSQEKDRRYPGFSWGNTVLTDEQRLRLRALEAKGVSLADMRHDALLNLYRDKANDTPYAVVAGKVYQLRFFSERGEWIIVDAQGRTGPRVALDAELRWRLNLDLRLRGGGGVLGTLKTMRADRTAEDVLIVEASGMTEIRLLYRDRARRIGQAHLRARRYLENCLDNLSSRRGPTGLSPAVTTTLMEFFGVQHVEARLITDVENAVKALLDAVMDQSLSPFTSTRFVVGTSRPGYEPITAFVIKGDPQRRVFLTERFFSVPRFALKPAALGQGFDAAAHYRAANLIHELSHQSLNTHDIAYLNSMTPYPDLLSVSDPTSIRMRAHAERLHTRRLSHLSDRADLFTVYEGNQQRDIEAGEEYGFNAILKITETSSLDDARDVFLADEGKRSRVMLDNADSVTLLVLLLGRTRHVGS